MDQIIFDAVEKAQAVIARWIVPDSDINSDEAMDLLLEILDNPELVQAQEEIKDAF